jgi:hypothetical protein
MKTVNVLRGLFYSGFIMAGIYGVAMDKSPYTVFIASAFVLIVIGFSELMIAWDKTM